MIWTTILVSAGVSAFSFFVAALVWRRRMRKELGTDTILENLRREVGEMVTELNGTTERNVALIENRIERLNNMLDRAGKTAGVLKRESEKHDIASQVYTSLERSRPVNSLNLSVVGETGSMSSETEDESGGAGRLVVEDQTGAISKQSESHGGVVSATASSSGSQTPEPPPEISDLSNLSPREKALVLFRNGESLESIAASLEMSRGEVELIISIHDRRHH